MLLVIKEWKLNNETLFRKLRIAHVKEKGCRALYPQMPISILIMVSHFYLANWCWKTEAFCYWWLKNENSITRLYFETCECVCGFITRSCNLTFFKIDPSIVRVGRISLSNLGRVRCVHAITRRSRSCSGVLLCNCTKWVYRGQFPSKNGSGWTVGIFEQSILVEILLQWC